jgi:RNA polymerase sigma-54 factor
MTGNYKIAEQIVGSLDDDGYLRREISSIADDLAFRQGLSVDEKEIETIVEQIQQFDPPGICARNLQECLLTAIEAKAERRKKCGAGDADTQQNILMSSPRSITKKYSEALILTDEQIKEVINQIIKLNPKPGGNIGEINKAESYIVPDFFVLNSNGKLELTLNAKNAPDLRISEGYRDMLKDYDKGSKKDKRQKEAVFSSSKK